MSGSSLPLASALSGFLGPGSAPAAPGLGAALGAAATASGAATGASPRAGAAPAPAARAAPKKKSYQLFNHSEDAY